MNTRVVLTALTCCWFVSLLACRRQTVTLDPNPNKQEKKDTSGATTTQPAPTPERADLPVTVTGAYLACAPLDANQNRGDAVQDVYVGCGLFDRNNDRYRPAVENQRLQVQLDPPPPPTVSVTVDQNLPPESNLDFIFHFQAMDVSINNYQASIKSSLLQSSDTIVQEVSLPAYEVKGLDELSPKTKNTIPEDEYPSKAVLETTFSKKGVSYVPYSSSFTQELKSGTKVGNTPSP